MIDQSILGHLVLYEHLLVDKKDYVGAARVYRRLSKVAKMEDPSEHFSGPFAHGVLAGSFLALPTGLIGIGRPFEAYHLILDYDGGPWTMVSLGGGPVNSGYCLAARAAALAGCGKGLDAPPLEDRPAIRKRALEWLNAELDMAKREVAALPVFTASTVGLMASPRGQGPLLWAVSALSPGSPHTAAYSAESREAVHDAMNHWLGDPDLAGVREDQELNQLPADERAQWRKLWGEVRSLRDRTAPAKAPPPVGK